MGGIEFYPQKEFDDDIEDKSDNDKIRVSDCFFFHTHLCHNCVFTISVPNSLAQSCLHSRTACSEQNARALGHFLYVSSHKPCASLFGTLNHDEMSLSIGDNALCCGGQRQRISSKRKTSSGEEDTVGNCRRWVVWPFLKLQLLSLAKETVLMFPVIYLIWQLILLTIMLQLKIPIIVNLLS